MPTGRMVAAVALVGVLARAGFAQAPAALLAGTVRDATGAVMAAVPVRVFDDDGGAVAEGASDGRGRFALPVPPGRYRVEIAAPSFAPFAREVTVPGGPLDVVLELDLLDVTLDVRPGEELAADTMTSLTATMLSGDELADLPRDEAELAEYLLALAGEDATGDLDADLASVLIDGFDGGRLPRPDQIAQIIIDPAPMSADGRGGPRIEIVTRPGTGTWRRSVELGFADESLNARTRGEARKEPRQTRDVELAVEGPLVPNVLAVSAELSTRADDRAGNSLRAVTPAGDLFQGVVQGARERELELGAELQLNARHRLDVRATVASDRSTNSGVGGFTLPERGASERGGDWSLQVTARMFQENLTNSLRVRAARATSRTTPLHEGIAVDVADAFNGGGGTARRNDESWSLRVDDNLRWQRGVWSLQWSGRLYYDARRRVDQDNFNGTFEFASLHDYCLATGLAGVNCAATARLVADAAARGVAPSYRDARGRAVAITGVPTTFTRAFGNAELAFSEVGVDTFIQADRRFGRRASLRLGARYDATSHSRSFLRLDPTFNLQYRVAPQTLVSAGLQLAFSDFTDYERLRRNDGSTHETELFISAPSFPDPFQGGAVEVDEAQASLWVLDPAYRPPYTLSPQVSLTQQVPGHVRLTLSYGASYGRRQRRTPNINAPYPGTPLPEAILGLPRAERQAAVDRMRPFFPRVGNITQVESTGRSDSHTLRLRVQPRGGFDWGGSRLSGNASYTYRAAFDDNDYANPHAREWGPSRRDHAVQAQVRWSLPDRVAFGHPLLQALARVTYAGTSLNLRLQANSGRLYSIRSGRDLNGDQSTRDRPPGVARNSEVGPATWNADLTFTKDYRPGAAGDGGAEGRRGGRARGPDGTRLRLQARVNNLFNHSQPRAYGSVVTSPLFGLPTGYTRGRTVTLSMSLDF